MSFKDISYLELVHFGRGHHEAKNEINFVSPYPTDREKKPPTEKIIYQNLNENFFCGPGFYYFSVPAFSIRGLQALGNR